MSDPIILTEEMLSEAPSDAIFQFVTKAYETQDAFIFETIRPFCEDKTHMTLTKDELIKVLTLLREQKQPGWVSVTERLPEEKGEYIAFDGETVFGAYYEIGTSGTRWTDATEGYWDYKVTHWRPMPEPPEGVSGDEPD